MVKKVLFAMIGTFVSVLLCSCPDQFKRNNNGYPKTVTLMGAGEKKIVEGGRGLFFMEISEAKLTILEDVDSFYYHKDWLTIKYKYGDNRFECIAQPNPTKDRRIVYIQLTFGDEYGLVDVIQDGNAEAASNAP